MIDFETELREAFDPKTGELTVSDAWEGFPGTAFGGFVAAASLVAAAGVAGHPRPLQLFTRFHRPVPVGRAVAVEIERERRGRLVDALTIQLTSEGKLLASMSSLFGRHGETPLDKQAAAPMGPLRTPAPVWEFLANEGMEPPPLMKRIGYRGESEAPEDPDGLGDWHLRCEWPASPSDDLAIRAAVALLPIDNFVGPAAMVANQIDLNGPWPVSMPSLDLTAWFYRPEARPPETDGHAGWLRTRTSVPVSWAGYTVGRTQVWAGDRLAAEGMSQAALVPMPT